MSSGTKTLKQRLRSVGNTRQITKAMELVAASRLRKAQEAARRSRSYSEITYAILHRVAGSAVVTSHPYFSVHPAAQRSLYLLFSSDRGLAGAYNTNLQNTLLSAISADSSGPQNIDLICFGRRGSQFFAKLKGINLLAVFDSTDEVPDPEVLAPVFKTIHTGAHDGSYKHVTLVYTRFITTLSQQVVSLPILPITIPEGAPAGPVFEFEPSADEVLARAAQLYIQSQLMQAEAEASASEQAMRMLAMSSASRNAKELIEDLTLELNATRQAGITQEIAEISAGTAAVS